MCLYASDQGKALGFHYVIDSPFTTGVSSPAPFETCSSRCSRRARSSKSDTRRCAAWLLMPVQCGARLASAASVFVCRYTSCKAAVRRCLQQP